MVIFCLDTIEQARYCETNSVMHLLSFTSSFYSGVSNFKHYQWPCEEAVTHASIASSHDSYTVHKIEEKMDATRRIVTNISHKMYSKCRPRACTWTAQSSNVNVFRFEHI